MRNPIAGNGRFSGFIAFPTRPNNIALAPMTTPSPGAGCNADQQRGDELRTAAGTIPASQPAGAARRAAP